MKVAPDSIEELCSAIIKTISKGKNASNIMHRKNHLQKYNWRELSKQFEAVLQR